MATTTKTNGLITKFAQEDYLPLWIEAFLIDRRAQNMTAGTLYYYKTKLKLFIHFCETQAVRQITQIDAGLIRQYLLWLESTGHNPGGCHQGYRTLKTFLLWWEAEVELDGWTNPIRKVKAPKLRTSTIEPVPLADIRAMVGTCDGSFTGVRDKSVLLSLLDTGARAQELLNITLSDIQPISGEITIRQGKGGKNRAVFLGKTSRKALRKYLQIRKAENEMLWVSAIGEPLTYWGLRQIIRRRAKTAIVPVPGLHDFRRAFAINMLRAGVDVFSLQKLMGHADLQVLRRYLAQTTEDIAQAHRMGSPVDNVGW